MGKKMLLNVAMALCALVIIPAAMMQGCTKPTYAPTNVNFTVDLSLPANSALTLANGSIVENGIVIIRTGASTYSAISNACTYQPCTVAFIAAYQEMVCPCCSGVFDENGNVVSGAPQAPLTKYTTTVSGHILTVKS